MGVFTSFLKNDWWIAIPMFLMSLTAVTLVIWRVLLNMNGNTKMSAFLPAFQQKLDKEGVEAAKAMCMKRDDHIPRKLFAAGLDVSKQGLSAARRAMANAIELDIMPELNFLLPSILAIAKIATMVGLFGTVVSMINTFNSIQQSGGDAAKQSGAIGLALFATALGLITAIPLVFAHVMFKAWIGRFEVEMKKSAQKLLLLLQAAKSKPAAATSAASAAAPPAAPPPVPLASTGGSVRR